MKRLINNIIHFIARITQRRVSYSLDEQSDAQNQAKTIASVLNAWKGDAGFEYIGLGQNCNASWYLKESELKKASYPFDWIFTTPEIICHMLEDDFSIFLKRDEMVPLGIDAGHNFYHASLFGHRNPAKSDTDYAFIQRCINRWKTVMHKHIPILFVTIVLNEPEKRKRFETGFTGNFKMPVNQKLADFQSAIKLIEALNPNSKFLFIEQHTETNFHLEITHKTENQLWLKYACKGANSGVMYLNKLDDGIV